jgi:hypothetical protein
MKYLTKKSSFRRYLLVPEYVSDNWVVEKWQEKNPGLNMQNLAVTQPAGVDPIPPVSGEVNTVEWQEDDIQTEEISFNCDFQLQNDILTYKLTNTTENRVLAHLSFPIDIFNGMYACSIIRMKDEVVEKHQKEIGLYEQNAQLVTASDIINSTASTLPTRAKYQLLPKKFNLVFWVNKDDPTADDIIPVVIRPRLKTESRSSDEDNFGIQYGSTSSTWGNHLVTFSGNLTKHEKDTVDQLAIEMLPAIEITSSTVSGDVITVNFSTDTNISTVYLGQDVGYLPKTTASVTNGTGSFKVVTTGLDAGEEVKVKLGHKYWSNQVTFTKTL